MKQLLLIQERWKRAKREERLQAQQSADKDAAAQLQASHRPSAEDAASQRPLLSQKYSPSTEKHLPEIQWAARSPSSQRGPQLSNDPRHRVSEGPASWALTLPGSLLPLTGSLSHVHFLSVPQAALHSRAQAPNARDPRCSSARPHRASSTFRALDPLLAAPCPSVYQVPHQCPSSLHPRPHR